MNFLEQASDARAISLRAATVPDGTKDTTGSARKTVAIAHCVAYRNNFSDKSFKKGKFVQFCAGFER
jgi:hypothetical protein